MSNFFARKAANEQRVLERSCESLIGICTGLMADQKLSEDEIHFLDHWLTENDDIANAWPGEIIFARVREVLKDGIITSDEVAYLERTLSDLIGGSIEEEGVASGMSTRLPLNEVDEIVIPGSVFCFTGTFVFGTRNSCHQATEERGGLIKKGVTKDLDYLIIGTMSTRDWAHTSHGRKIEKAVSYQEKGRPILILSEEQWAGSL